MIKLGNILKDSIARAGIKKQVDSVLILEKFNQIVIDILGSDIAKELKPLYLKNKILTVASLNPSLSQEIKLREKTILYKLNNEIGRDAVERIIFSF